MVLALGFPRIIDHGRTEVVPDRLSRLLEVASDNILVPTLLVRGELSDIVTQEGVDMLLSHIDDITVVDVAGAAHMIAGDRNDEFTSAVIDFLDDRVSPTLAKSDEV